ncbi:hypothetical protein TBLA_0B03420 [Henningerozyma blattae CBS 6284]|uniref:Serine hydrolase domain-containing protein n=1 Tax=Henningerozyma blattae (strain ATCC 34711 / CBS 6284 / DSM 70876 / NBRC 10599 / NRRL Y-10934 / UCD 77-7) TaxID=1071380 RepID=I2GYI1_HENB6|nr:hypothetical protein TBLA_0B03420 [Tetrapisispora blattae CBS 6284]CCH59183.1 hypothetical protein TBLA_0B03420 [Tetrapisispora blattae CBS 6284]
MPKILLLHGYMQSDTIVSAKTGALRKALKKMGYQVFTPCGQYPVYSEDVIQDEIMEKDPEITTNKYGWWKKSKGENPLSSYKISSDTFKYLHDYLLQNGPFEGIAGFSQGGGLAGYLATDVPGLLDLPKSFTPSFMLIFSGFRLEPEQLVKQYKTSPITIPSLHILGEMDTVVDENRSLKLYDECPDDLKTLLRHSGGHVVPNSKIYVQQMCAWISANTDGSSLPPSLLNSNSVSTTTLNSTENNNKATQSTTDSKKDLKKPDLDQDLLDMIDGLGKI